MLIDITTEFAAWSKIPGLETLIKTAAQAAVFDHGEEFKNRAELSILLTSDETIRQLNLNFRGQDKPTNVLSFVGETQTVSTVPSFLLGDVVLSFQTIAGEAEQQGKSFDNHVSHLIVHGVLHLLGYDHDSDKIAEEMERAEIKILQGIGVENPYSHER